MNLSDIFSLWDRFDSSDLSEMEIDMEGTHFHLVGGFGKKEAPREVLSTIEKEDLKKVEENQGQLLIKAPLIGTFYQAPSPDAPPFVQPGQEIHKGDVIGIIEAMKLMNEVVSDVDGTVAEILVQDGAMVEFDQVLVTLS